MWHEAFINKDGVTQYRFYEKYRDPLTQRWKRTSVVMNKNTRPSEKEAQKQLQAKIKAILNDKTPVTLKTLTFHQACDEWLEAYKMTSGTKRTTHKEKQSHINSIKAVVDENALISKMTTRDVQELFNNWHKLGRSKSIMRGYITTIKLVFKHAKAYSGLKDISFLDDVIVPSKARTREEIAAKRQNYLEKAELDLLIKTLDGMVGSRKTDAGKRNTYIIARIVEFQACNGMRIGELLAIQPDNLNFEKKTLLIDGSMIWERDEADGGFGVKDTTKNEHSYRSIKLTMRSLEILKEIILENKKSAQWEEGYQDRGFIFTNSSGNPLLMHVINDTIAEAVKEAGINKKVTTHTLRHTHISTLSQLGISLKAIMDRVGHTDHKTTLQIYSHVTEQMDQEMIDKLEAAGQ